MHYYENFLRQSDPLLNKIEIKINEILHIYQHIQFNKKICGVLLDRIQKIKTFVNSSKYRPISAKSSKEYQPLYDALHQLLYLLEEIKEFIDDMSHLKKFRKCLNIEQKFKKIIDRYDDICIILINDQSTTNEAIKQKEMRYLQSDLADNKKFLKHIQGGIIEKDNNISTIFEEIESLEGMKTSLNFNISTLKLNSANHKPSDTLQKMQIIGLNNINDIAIKPLIGFKLSNNNDNTQLITEIAILKKLKRSKNIIKFYGIMKLNIGFISVYEWAEGGNLKDYYEIQGNDFNWNDKLRIALDICRGLCFLQNANIPHRNIRCENVLLSKFLEAKITGFQKNYSHILQFEKGNKKDEIRWSAPEYLANKKQWNIKSEIFSYVMLLWELGHQKIPYSDLKDDKEISEIIISGEKKNFDNMFNSNNYLKKYKKIICDAWTIDPNIRPTIIEIFLKLLKVQELYLHSIRQQSIYDESETIQNENIGIQLLEFQDFQNPLTTESDRRGKKLIKKLYTKESIEVACKPLNTLLFSTNKIQEIVSIFKKLGNDSIHIIKFYGLANLNNNCVNLITEWAELGNLQETYEIYKISWKLKIQMALDICDGLKFIHGCHVFHRNLRCKSIKVNQLLKPKIANFEIATEEKKSTDEFNPLNINWAAPELFKNNKYSYNCDIFSFVMLLWELAFEKIPYINWNNQRIIDHIKNGNHEKIDFDKNDPDIQDIQKDIRNKYLEIIQKAWRQKRNLDILRNYLNKLYEPIQNIRSEISFKESTKFEKNLRFNIGIKNKYLQEAIKFRFIDLIPYDEFENEGEIGSGNFGRICKAHWKKTHEPVACKYLINSTDNIQHDKYWQAFTHELNLHSRGSKSENIIKILGISYSIQDERLLLIMEYASDGDLRTYLKSKNNTLTIEKKVKLAFDVTKGLYYLHKINIIHRDLHAKNIVIHEGKAKITDFVRIIDGCREECVGNNIPRKYSELYKSCWVGEPEKRPNIGDIREIMDDIYNNLNTHNDIDDQSSELSIEETSFNRSTDSSSEESRSIATYDCSLNNKFL
ncbi:unnamed protein product [Rhizophagus irregularis]|nr:unnamed protein product [Rhizophagus irregularis]